MNGRDNDNFDPKPANADKKVERSLRPRSFGEYIGQESTVENLSVFITAAKKRNEALDHALFWAPPGLGKTTLAHIIANELGVNIFPTSGPAIDRKGDLAGILTNLQECDVLFIDEIHRLSPMIEENLYPAMEDFEFDIIIGEGPHAKNVKLPLQHFTLIGATTRSGMLTSPLRDRFGIIVQLNYYAPEELVRIVNRAATILDIKIEKEAAWEIAKRSRGTPRIANRLLRRVRDFADFADKDTITLGIARHGLAKLLIDDVGLDEIDRKILESIIHMFSGGPVGQNTLCAAMSMEKDTLEDVYEPYLIQQGYLQRTPKGRVATERAYRHLNVLHSTTAQGDLFGRSMTSGNKPDADDSGDDDE